MGKGIILVTATAMEMQVVMQGLGLNEVAPEPGASLARRVRGIPVRFVCSGIGPLAAAFIMGCLAGEGALSPARCRGVLSLGIAGTYARHIAPIGSVVMADAEIWPEYGLLSEHGVDPVALGFPLMGKKDDVAPPPVWDTLALNPAAALAAMGLANPAVAMCMAENPLVVTGAGITVAAVSGTRSRAEELAARYAALSENMESFPLALAAARLDIPFAEIRSISNLVGDRSKEAWDIPAALVALSRVSGQVFSI